ncbi:MAG: hypothetical protein IJ817_01130, partial [Clostridia bacterium]|nr:hypothetical protein [Clostridia bacterium]
MSEGNNKNLTEAINELEEVFRDRFHFSENQVKEFIERILKNGDEEVTQKLSDAMKKFVEFAGSPKDESRAFATRAVKRALDLYLDRQEEIKDDFFLMVDDIKNHNVDPYKIAYKENYREADYDAYEKTLSALTEKVYSDGVTNFKLFDETALKDLLETCSTIIFRVTEENTQDIIDYLSVLMYDENSKSFIMSPKELISKVPSLLLRSADSIATNIEALKKLYVNDKFSEVDLARKIAQTPSILTCSTDNISYFNTKYKSVMRNLIFKRGVSSNGNNKFGVDLHELYNKTVESVLNNIDNLSWISQLTEDNINSIENISKVLYKRLGVKNALACMRNVNFLTKEPDLLDCLICTLVEKQKQTGENYIKYLIEHPNMAFNGRFGLTSSGSAPTVAPVPTHKKNRVTADKIDEITAEEIKRVKLANKKHSAKVEMIIQNIIDGMNKPQEEPVVEEQTKVPTITPPQENVSAPTTQ